MNQVQHQQASIHTQSRTQKSPTKQTFGINYRSNHTGTHTPYSNIEIQYMRFKEQSKKQLQNLMKQNQQLRDQIYRKNDEIEHLKSTVIINLKKDLNDTQRENIKNFKEIQRQARQIQKLIADNHSMEQNIEKNLRQRKTYFSKLDELKEIKQTTRRQILEKDKIIRTYAQINKKLEKQLAVIKLQNQDLTEEKGEIERKLFESQSQYKSMLEMKFIKQNQLKVLQLKQRQSQFMLNNYAEKLDALEKEKQELLDRLDEQENRNLADQSNRSNNIEQMQVIQVKALMEQIYTLLDDKKKENKNSQKKFLASITCLEKALPRK